MGWLEGAKVTEPIETFRGHVLIRSVEGEIQGTSDHVTPGYYALKVKTMDEKIGWLNGTDNQICKKTNVTNVAKDDVLNIRKGKDYKSKKVAELKPGQEIFVNFNLAALVHYDLAEGCSNQFVPVLTTSKSEGYVHCSFFNFS